LETTKVFVYGTLRKDEPAHGHLEHMGAKFLGYDTVCGRKTTVYGRYPGLIKGLGLVSGEVYEIPLTGLLLLDTYESVDHGAYYREKVTTSGGLRVWTYFATIEEDKELTRIA